MILDPNDMAFPASRSTSIQLGLTKREYFAALAMQGIIGDHLPEENYQGMAVNAVLAADALIAELSKVKP